MNQNVSAPSIGYRQDIDGLRAIAIWMVVSFHYFGTRGGFTGVDVFFVISGYLITGNIVSEISSGSFNISTFYARRIRRIFPALIAMFIATALAAWIILFPHDFRNYGKHLAGGATYIANFVLLGEASYFDGSVERKPFLHLWSLGVEEQFYLLWPISFVIAKKFLRGPWIVVIATLLISFGANIAIIGISRDAAFYLPLTRFWELAVGGFLVLIKNAGKPNPLSWPTSNSSRNAYSIVGLFIIILSTYSIRPSFSFPGWWASLPVIGAVLLIAAGEKAIVNKFILASKPMVWIGRISYPLYLWHWPILAMANIYNYGVIQKSWKLPLLALSILLAHLSYRYIETPIRKIPASPINTRRFLAAGIILSIAAAGLGISFWQGLLPARLANVYAVPEHTPKITAGCFFEGLKGHGVDDNKFRECIRPQLPKAHTVMVIGDSHSLSLFQGIEPFLKSHGLNAIGVAVFYCTPLSFNDGRPACAEYNKKIRSAVEELRPDVVVISANYMMWPKDEAYRESADFPGFLSRQAENLLKFGARNVIVVGQIPTWEISLPAVLNSKFLRSGRTIPERTYDGVVPESLAFDGKMSKQTYVRNTSFMSLRSLLCNSQGCLTKVGDHLPDQLIVSDYGHVTPAGAKYIVDQALGEKIISLLR